MRDDPILVKRVAVEEAQGADGLVEAAPGGFLLMSQIKLIGADVFGPSNSGDLLKWRANNETHST